MADFKILQEKGVDIYPITHPDAVRDENGNHAIVDAPADDKQYARKNGEWSEVAESSQIIKLPFIDERSSDAELQAFLEGVKDNVGKDVIFAMDVAMMGASLNPYFVHYSNDEDEGEVAVAQFSPDPGYDQIIGVTYKDGVYSFTEESFESASVDRLNGKQDNLVSGENIKTINGNSILGPGNIEISGEDNVFLARYGITTWAEINEAASNGKLIHATFNGRLYNLETALPVESGAIIFYTVQAANSMRLSVVQPNTWTNSSYALQQAQNRKSTIDPTSTTDYPNSKAVADYVAEQIGNINSILETI